MKNIQLFERSRRMESASHRTLWNWPQWFDDISLAIVPDREDVEVRPHAPQIKTEYFWMWVGEK